MVVVNLMTGIAHTDPSHSPFSGISMTRAHQESLKLMACLDLTRAMDFDLPEDRRRPEFSTDYLFGPSRGKMLGVLVCRDAQGNETVLKAFSSQYNGRWHIPGWVPPVIDSEAFDALVRPVDVRIKELDSLMALKPGDIGLRLRRKTLSVNLAAGIQDLYRFRDFSGKEHSFRQLWQQIKPGAGIPAGTGDCCAPKLLHAAAVKGLTPFSMAEFFYGKENQSGTRTHGVWYPPCDEKCVPLLATLAPCLLDSRLTVYYRDEHLAVAEKPAGMLAVPGRGPDKLDSAAVRITRLFPESIPQPAVHRLDMATSGLMVFGLTVEAHRALSLQFQRREVHKAYTAVLNGVPDAVRGGITNGTIELPFRLDVDNRPLQIYDAERGKIGISDWTLAAVEEHPAGPRARVLFFPQTGRTHQLRLHASHPGGFGCPIAGDPLYGQGTPNAPDQRLLLHAHRLEFTHPSTGCSMVFHSPPPF
ncbi:MAG: RluA family pseudouridine synthase [Spirochaetales bacterium]|nr:RluA family pseudouridine synthase [Spirochaetales bacterium]